MIECYVLYKRLEFVHSIRNFCLFLFVSKSGFAIPSEYSVSEKDILTFLFMRKVAIKLMKLRMLWIEYIEDQLYSKLKVKQRIANENK